MRREDFVQLLTQETVWGVPISAREAGECWDSFVKKGCCICGGSMAGVACFKPHDSLEYGGTPGLERQFWYPLCEKHPPSEQVAKMVEEKIERLLLESARAGEIH